MTLQSLNASTGDVVTLQEVMCQKRGRVLLQGFQTPRNTWKHLFREELKNGERMNRRRIKALSDVEKAAQLTGSIGGRSYARS